MCGTSVFFPPCCFFFFKKSLIFNEIETPLNNINKLQLTGGVGGQARCTSS